MKYLIPHSLKEASELLIDNENSFILAGGTDLLIEKRSGKITPDAVIDLKRINHEELYLSEIVVKNGKLEIGALVTVTQLLEYGNLPSELASLIDAGKKFGCYEIRNRATLAGNLAHASPGSEYGSTLISLDAEVEIFNSKGVKNISVESIYAGAGRNALKRGDIITKIIIPVIENSGSAYFRASRVDGMDLAIINCALRGIYDRNTSKTSNIITIRDLTIDTYSREVKRSNKKIKLKNVKLISFAPYLPDYEDWLVERVENGEERIDELLKIIENSNKDRFLKEIKGILPFMSSEDYQPATWDVVKRALEENWITLEELKEIIKELKNSSEAEKNALNYLIPEKIIERFFGRVIDEYIEDYDALNTIRRKEPTLEIILKLDLINFITNKLLIYPYYLMKDKEGEWVILEEEELNNPAAEFWRKGAENVSYKGDVSYEGYKYSLRFRVFEKLFFQNWSLTKGAGMLLGRSTYARYTFKIAELIRKHYEKEIQEALNKNDDKKLLELVEKKEKALSEFIEKSTYILMSVIQFEGKQHEDFRKKNASPKGNRKVTELLQQEDIDDLFRYIEEPFGEVVRNIESIEAESVKSAESEADKGNAIDFNKVLKSINTLYEKLNKSEEDKLKVVKIMKKLADEKVEKNEGPYILWKTGWKNFVKNIWTSLKIITKGDKKGSIKESLISHRGKRTWQKITIATLLFNLLLLGAVVSLIHLKFQVFGIISPSIGWLITILSTGAIVVSVWALLFHKFRPLAFVVLTGISTVVVYLAKMYGFAIGMAAFGVGVIIWVLLLPLTWYSFRDIVGSFVSWRAREKQFERRSGIKFRHSLIFRWTGLGGRKLAKTLNRILYDKEGKERLPLFASSIQRSPIPAP